MGKWVASIFAAVISGLILAVILGPWPPSDEPRQEESAPLPDDAEEDPSDAEEDAPLTSPPARPDLVARIVGWPSGPVPTGRVPIDVAVSNFGTADYSGPIAVELPSVPYELIDGLAVGTTETLTLDFPAVSSNVTYTLTATVDPEDLIAEEDETNNVSPGISFETLP